MEHNYAENISSGFRLPLQLNLHLAKAPVKSDWFLKAVFTNYINFQKTVVYEDGVKTGTSHRNSYDPLIGLGIGYHSLNEPVGIIIEGLIEKSVYLDYFTESTLYSIKIGVIFQENKQGNIR